MSTPKLTASYITLAGAGFTEPPRFTFRQRCEAASAAGFAGIGIHLNDLKTLNTADVADILSDNNLELGEIEFFAGWAAPGSESAARETLEEVRELAASTGGGDHLSSGDFGGGPLDIAGAATRLQIAAEAVADVGLKIAIEAFAWSAINSVPTARDLLARVDAPNAGHLLDVWHFYNTGSTAESITDLDVTTVAAVQLNDGPRVHDNFLWHARNTRLLPGEGDLDVRGFVTALKSIGYDGPFGIESSYPEFRQLDAGEAAARAFDATMNFL
jgi:sugar phosphate isomerase/epimerase